MYYIYSSLVETVLWDLAIVTTTWACPSRRNFATCRTWTKKRTPIIVHNNAAARLLRIGKPDFVIPQFIAVKPSV